ECVRSARAPCRCRPWGSPYDPAGGTVESGSAVEDLRDPVVPVRVGDTDAGVPISTAEHVRAVLTAVDPGLEHLPHGRTHPDVFAPVRHVMAAEFRPHVRTVEQGAGALHQVRVMLRRATPHAVVIESPQAVLHAVMVYEVQNLLASTRGSEAAGMRDT